MEGERVENSSLSPKSPPSLSFLIHKIRLLWKNMLYYVIRIKTYVVTLGEEYIYKFTLFPVSVISLGAFSNG